MEKHLQGRDAGVPWLLEGKKKKKDFCTQKRLLFPCISEKEAKFMVERSGDSGKWIDCQLMFYRHINSSLKTDISLH